ncbi:EamA family transporter [Candidatus Woesearchaeota archaeon]|nr:EamA family transporter [Candidatus Woesearchaeota archaeon]
MNQSVAIILILISSVIGAFSTLYFKIGSSRPIDLKNTKLGLAVLLGGLSFIFYVYALKFAPLTFIYLTASVSYIWAVVLAKFALKEQLNKHKLLGVALIMLGIVVMNVGN